APPPGAHRGGVDPTGGRPPRRQPFTRPRDRAARREPERELVGGRGVQRAPQGPRLHERAVTPERVADVLLRDAVDARAQLQLGRGLYLRVDAADTPHDLQQIRGTLRDRKSTRLTP